MGKSELATKVELIEFLLPNVDEFVRDVESNNGYLVLPNEIIQTLCLDGLPGWAKGYVNFNILLSYCTHALYDKEVLDNLKSDSSGEYAKELEKELLNELENAEEITEEEFLKLISKEKKDFEIKLKKDESFRIEAQSLYFLTLYGFLGISFHFLAIMTFGKSICLLVKEAQEGNDDSFCKAVQIDRTVLSDIPYFRKRLIRAQLDMDEQFLNSFSKAIKSKPLAGKIRYRTLWVLFSILDYYELLNLPHEKILDICERVGVYGKEHGVEDVGHLSHRIRDYRRKQGRHLVI